MKKCILLSLLLSALVTSGQQNPTSVETVKPEIRSIKRESHQPVILEALNSAEIGTRVSGRVDQILVDIGDQVKTGDLLAKIHAPELFAQKKIAEAEKQRISILVQSAQADFDAAKAEDMRIQKLVEGKSLSEKVALESKSKLASAEASLAAAQAENEIAAARLEAAEAFITFTELRAPYDGVVVSRLVDLGDQVTKDTTPLFIVENISNLRAVMYIPERDAVEVDVGDSVIVKLDAFPGQTYTTKVSRTSKTVASVDAQRMRVEADLPNTDRKLPSGLYGSATITLQNKENAILVPAGAVRFGENPVCVYIVEDDVVRHRPVTLGLDDGKWLEVTSGLQGRESIVVNLLGRLPEGTQVTVR